MWLTSPGLRAFPIAKALDHGADVVITGRCIDSALALAPLIHKVLAKFLCNYCPVYILVLPVWLEKHRFGPPCSWKVRQPEPVLTSAASLLSTPNSSLAGHIVECGAQATGGIFTDWDKVNGW